MCPFQLREWKSLGQSSGLACALTNIGDRVTRVPFLTQCRGYTHERARGQNRTIQNKSFRIFPLQYIVPVNFSLTCYSYACISGTWSYNKLDFLECIVIKTIFTNFSILLYILHVWILCAIATVWICPYYDVYQQGSSLFRVFHKLYPNSSAPHLPRLESNQAYFCSPLGFSIQPYLSLFVPNFISL